MNRFLSWLIVLGLAAGISACDKKERVPLPKTGAGEIKQQAKEAELCRWFDYRQNVLDIPFTAIELAPKHAGGTRPARDMAGRRRALSWLFVVVTSLPRRASRVYVRRKQ